MTFKVSQQLNEILSALSIVQGKIENAEKNSKGFQAGHKYADLGQYLKASKDLLSENGLSITQIPGGMEIVEITKEVYDKDSKSYSFQNIFVPKQTVTMMIGHSSGQFIMQDMQIIVEKTSGNSWGQSTGASVTFSRRYGTAGGLNMTQEDNDNQYSKEDVDKSYNIKKSLPGYPKSTKDQINRIKDLLTDNPTRVQKILIWKNISSLEELPFNAANEVINILLKEQSENIKNVNLISEHEINIIQKLVTPERLIEILETYGLKRLEDMTIEDYHKEYDKLRLETTIEIKKQAIN